MLGTHRETCGPRPSRAFGCQTPGVRGRARPRSSPVGGRGSGSDQSPSSLLILPEGWWILGFSDYSEPQVLDEDFMSPKTSVCGFMSRVQGAGEAPQAEHAALAVVCGSQWDRDLDVKIQVHLRFSGLLRKSRDSKSQSIVATNEFCRRRVNRGNQLESMLLLRTVTVERRGGTALGNGGTPVYKLPMRRRTFSDSAMAICM